MGKLNLMRIYFNKTVCITCGILSVLMIRASFWQWDRHHEKLAFIEEMEQNLEKSVVNFRTLTDPMKGAKKLWFRRATVEGRFLYDKEMLLRNRRFEGEPGFHLLTPLELSPELPLLIVNRGFVPLRFGTDIRKVELKRPKEVSTTVLLKQDMPRKFLSPIDSPTGLDREFVRNLLRVDIEHIQKQFDRKLFPFFAEIVPEHALANTAEQLIQTKSGKDELLLLAGRATPVAKDGSTPASNFPIPALNTFIPAGRHLGYVYEWAIMAVGTLLIGFIIQLRPRKNQPLEASS